MQPQEVEPPAAWQDIIKCFWYTRLDVGALPASFEVQPDGYAEIIFYFGSTCGVATSQGPQALPSPFVVGLLRAPALFYTQGCLEILGIRCFPWAVSALLGQPPAQGDIHVVADALAHWQVPLAEQLQAGGQMAALALLAQYFKQTSPPLASDSLLRKAGGAMWAAHGTLPVSQVAAAAHATIRTLERRFKHSAGHTVKDVSALIRFEQARNYLWLNPAASLAHLALELGYTDQAHLSREFKRFSGTTPAAFARRARQR